MRDREYPIVIYAVPQGGLYHFESDQELEVATRATAGHLASALARTIGLSQQYALYVRLPDDFSLNRLGLDSIDKVLLIPSEAELGEIVRRRKK